MDTDSTDFEFDTIRIKQFIEEQTNVSIVMYLITIVLYVISFTYLFRKDSTEYMIWVLMFILNFITPFIWITDMSKLLDYVGRRMPVFNKNVLLYGFFSLVISFFLTFIGLLMVLLKNEEVRKIKKKQGHYENSTEMPDLKTNIKEVEKKDRKISILYTTIVTLMWGMVAFNFGEYLRNDPSERTSYPFGSRIKSLMDIVPNILSWIDSTIHYYFRDIPLPPLVKSTFVYIVVFIAVFFGIFAKITYIPDSSTGGLKEQLEIVNMLPMFPRRFDREFTQIRHFVIFMVGLLSTITFGSFIYFISKMVPSEQNIIPDRLIYILMSIFAVIIFPVLFTNQTEWFPKSTIKDISFFFVCIVFGLLGAAPITAIVELVLGLFRSYGMGIFLGESASYVYSISLVLLTAIMFSVGMAEDWIDTDGKSMKTFLVILVTMIVSLFMALSTEYSVFKNLYDVIALILRFTMKFIAPIIMVILSCLIVFYSHANYKIINKRANDNIAHEIKEKNTPNKTTNPIKEQRKIRNMLQNSYNQFTSYFDVNSRMKGFQNVFGS